MKVVIDTSSLLSLVRYYIPFDTNGIMLNFIKSKIAIGEIIIIDKVFQECTLNSKGLVVSKLDFLQDNNFLKSIKLPYKTELLLAPSPAKFLRQLENQFVNSIVRKLRKLSDVEFENQKNIFLNDADMKQIILCLNLKKDGEDVFFSN